MVAYAMDMVLSSEFGNSTVCTLEQEKLNPGTLLMEALYVLEPMDKVELQSSRFLPPTTIRIMIDEDGKLLNMNTCYINENQTRVADEIIKEVINIKSDVIKMLLGKSRDLAEKEVPELKHQAMERMNDILKTEVARLTHMRKINSNVRIEEIDFFKNQLQTASYLIESATIRLDALRIIVTI